MKFWQKIAYHTRPAISPSQHIEIAQGVSTFQAPSLRVWRNSWQAKKKGLKRTSPFCSEAPPIGLCEAPPIGLCEALPIWVIFVSVTIYCWENLFFCEVSIFVPQFGYFVELLHVSEGKWFNKKVEKYWRFFKIFSTTFLKNSSIWCKKSVWSFESLFVIENWLLIEKKTDSNQ